MPMSQNLTCPPPDQSSSLIFKISKIVASGDDGNKAENVLDTDFGTRWSNKGKGSFLNCEPAYVENHKVNQIRIAFYKGNERSSSFIVQESTDGTNFVNVSKAFTSSGKSDGLEVFNLDKETNAKNVRLVFNGNSKDGENGWNSVTTLQLVDDPSWKPGEVIPPITPEPPVTPPPGPVTPPTPTDGTFKSLTKDGVGIVYEAIEVFYNYRDNSRDDGKRRDFNGLGSKCNKVSIGGYFKFNGTPPKDEVSGKCRGGKHSGAGKRVNCYDMGHKIYGGAQRQRIEEIHPDYKNEVKGGTGPSVKDKFIGFQFVCFPVPEKKMMVSEIWIDDGDNEGTKPANKWKRTSRFEETKYYFEQLLTDHAETIRIDDPEKKGLKQLVEKWIFCANLK